MQNNIYLSTDSVISSFYRWLNWTSASINLIAAVLGLIIVIIGVVCIKELRKELRLRSFDSVFGFHAMLRANLLCLREAAGSVKNSKRDREKINKEKYINDENAKKEASKSIFLHFLSDPAKEAAIKEIEKASNKIRFDKEDVHVKLFMSHVNKTIDLFTKTTGQIPLSKKMHDKWDELLITLLDIKTVYDSDIKYSLALNPNEVGDNRCNLADVVNVWQKADIFNDLTADILHEISILTPKYLGALWKENE